MEQKQKKMFVAMSHELQPKQIADLKNIGYGSYVISRAYQELAMNRLSPHLASDDLLQLAQQLINEAIELHCEGIAMTGEPMLTFHVWFLAYLHGLEVWQSTTERITKEVPQPDGSVLKTQIFDHVQWRELQWPEGD